MKSNFGVVEAIRSRALPGMLLPIFIVAGCGGGGSGNGGTGTGDGAQQLDACAAAMLDEPRVVCEDEPFYGNHRDDSGEFVTFVPLVTGHYTVELFGDPGADDENTGRCSWSVHKEPDASTTELGNSRYGDGFCGEEDVTTYRLNAEDKYYVAVDVQQDDPDGPDARFMLSVTRVTEGKDGADTAVEIPVGETYDAVVGNLTSPSMEHLTSYYRFEVMQGTYTVSAGGYPCGSGGELRLHLYEDAFTTRIESGQADGTCRQAMDVALEAGTYYLKVENWLGTRDTSRPAPGRVSFDLKVEAST